MAVAPWIVSDDPWELVEPLLPERERRFRYPGSQRLSDREAVCGILFVLHTGIAWQHLPAELGFGSARRCRRGAASEYSASSDALGSRALRFPEPDRLNRRPRPTRLSGLTSRKCHPPATS
jgi:transposase